MRHVQGAYRREIKENHAMFVTHKRMSLLHLSGKVTRTTADHPFFVAGQGWTEAADLQPGDKLRSHDGQHVPVEGITDSGEQEVLYHLNPGELPMPDQPRPSFPIFGFAAGTSLLTADGPKHIEDVKPGDVLQTRPDDQGDGELQDAHDEGCDCPDQDPRWWQRN
jgi:hypothetical protein